LGHFAHEIDILCHKGENDLHVIGIRHTRPQRRRSRKTMTKSFSFSCLCCFNVYLEFAVTGYSLILRAQCTCFVRGIVSAGSFEL